MQRTAHHAHTLAVKFTITNLRISARAMGVRTMQGPGRCWQAHLRGPCLKSGWSSDLKGTSMRMGTKLVFRFTARASHPQQISNHVSTLIEWLSQRTQLSDHCVRFHGVSDRVRLDVLTNSHCYRCVGGSYHRSDHRHPSTAS